MCVCVCVCVFVSGCVCVCVFVSGCVLGKIGLCTFGNLTGTFDIGLLLSYWLCRGRGLKSQALMAPQLFDTAVCATQKGVL